MNEDMSKYVVISDREYQTPEGEDPGALKFALGPESYCDAGCAYCGQSHVRGDPGSLHRGAVQRGVTEAIARPSTKVVRVNWLGEEPMMAFEVIGPLSRALVAAASEHGVFYLANISTHGCRLDLRKLRILVEECRVIHYEITLPGPSAGPGAHRAAGNGMPSLDRIMTVLQAALDDSAVAEASFSLRTNVDSGNSEYIGAYIDDLARREWLVNERVSFSLIPSRSWSDGVSAIQPMSAARRPAKAHAERLTGGGTLYIPM